jgi:hypothetical protein
MLISLYLVTKLYFDLLLILVINSSISDIKIPKRNLLVNAKMIPFETTPGMGGCGGKGEQWKG